MREAATEERYLEAVALLRQEIPPVKPPSPHELRRRKAIVERILQRSDRVGPIGIRADDLLHEAELESRY